ncbi:MAG: hypothetical protein ABI683_14775 [Ginsengibacter sp.]
MKTFRAYLALFEFVSTFYACNNQAKAKPPAKESLAIIDSGEILNTKSGTKGAIYKVVKE